MEVPDPQEFTPAVSPNNSDLVIHSGHSGPYVIINEDRFLSCHECHKTQELNDSREGYICGRMVDKKACMGRMVICGKPIKDCVFKSYQEAENKLRGIL